MPTKSKSYLKVLLWEATEEREVLVWQLLGYHGSGWSVAQVVLPSSVAIQVSEASNSLEGNLFLLYLLVRFISMHVTALIILFSG